MGKKMSFSQLVIGKKDKLRVYLDAVVINVHTDSYDVITSNGEVKKYVSNTTSGVFANGDSVAVLLDRISNDYRIIGRGRKLSNVLGIRKVEV